MMDTKYDSRRRWLRRSDQRAHYGDVCSEGFVIALTDCRGGG